MSQRIVVDSLAYAKGSRAYAGEAPVAALERVLDMLADTSGCVNWKVVSSVGAKNRPRLTLEINGELNVLCQRCLQGMAFPISIGSVLEFVEDEEDLTQEELEDDSVDFLPMQGEVDLLTLVEDEIILSLPSVPRHEKCALPGAGQKTERDSPFSVLKGLAGKA